VKGKVVFITGASSGIGKAVAETFAREGAKVVLTFNKGKKEAEALARTCKEDGAQDTLAVHLDVRDYKSIVLAMKKVVAKFEKIDLLVNNAGVAEWKHLIEQAPEDIEAQVSTNLTGLMLTTKEALPHVKDMIINIASGAGMEGYPGLAPYCATKFGVRGFSQALAQEVKHLKVAVVNPSMTATRMTNFRGIPPEQVAEIVLNTALGKYDHSPGGDVNVWEKL
jgi:NAD(P)-dependent dehydrogenase (short-subunit alcohol dehydrogenase family)